MDRRQILEFAAIAGVANFAAPMAFAAEPEIFTGLVEGTGAGGFDVVSYFSGAPSQGKAEFASTYKGAKWLFSSADNMKAFEADPAKYAPQYGGYCAYAVSKGATAKGEPEVWSVVDGKLYLNFSKDIQAKWKADIPGHIAAANANWPKVLE
jgi:YHS domain-containing protein